MGTEAAQSFPWIIATLTISVFRMRVVGASVTNQSQRSSRFPQAPLQAIQSAVATCEHGEDGVSANGVCGLLNTPNAPSISVKGRVFIEVEACFFMASCRHASRRDYGPGAGTGCSPTTRCSHRLATGFAARPSSTKASMYFHFAANAVLLFHLAFIVFAVFGAALAFRWRWIPYVHLPSASLAFFF